MRYKAVCQTLSVQNKIQLVPRNRIFNAVQTCIEICVCLSLGWGFLFRGSIVAKSVRGSLFLCANRLIPSLFCFMVFTSFLSLSGIGQVFAGLLRPVTYFLRLPKVTGTAVLMSFLGGYPIGAKNISDLYHRQEINQSIAARMMIFCCCPAPSFVILAVGVELLQSRKLGLILYASQVLSVLILGKSTALFCCRKEGPYRNDDSIKHLPKCSAYDPIGSALVESVAFASSAMLPICGYVVLFGAFGALLQDVGLPEKLTVLLTAFLEVTTGTARLAELSTPVSLAVMSFFLHSVGCLSCFR